MKQTQVGIKDIAKKLNVSISTVSRALRDNPSISEKTRRDVQALAKSLQYEPDLLASSLRKRESNTIGVLIPNFLHYFFSAVISGIEDIAGKEGYTVMVSQSNDSFAREKACVKSFLSHKVDGLLVAVSHETTDFTHFELLKNRNIPLIFFDRNCDFIFGPKVMATDYDGALELVEHLISQGCHRIAHIGGPRNLSISKRRLLGYTDALVKHNLPVDQDLIVESDFTEERTRQCVQNLIKLKDRPDAIFAITDPDAAVAIETLKKEGIKIPTDIAVAGFGNDRIAKYIDPPLTSVAQNPFEMGRVAARLFLEEKGSDQATKIPKSIQLKTKLIIRQSTGRSNV